MTVAELLRRISSRELTEWMAFGQLEPFGAEANFLGHAITSKTIADVNRGKGQKPFEVSDFMPRMEGKKAQTVEEQIQIAHMITIGMGGKDLRKKEE